MNSIWADIVADSSVILGFAICFVIDDDLVACRKGKWYMKGVRGIRRSGFHVYYLEVHLAFAVPLCHVHGSKIIHVSSLKICYCRLLAFCYRCSPTYLEGVQGEAKDKPP
jgi:hypothetical protein